MIAFLAFEVLGGGGGGYQFMCLSVLWVILSFFFLVSIDSENDCFFRALECGGMIGLRLLYSCFFPFSHLRRFKELLFSF